MQGTIRALLALAVLCWIGAATPSALRAQPAPPPVSIVSAAGDVRALIGRLEAVTARIKAHPFAPAYYAEPCEPTKQEGEASLAPFRRELRALRAEAERLEAEIRALERNSGNKLIMAEHGWDFQNLKRWQPLKGALQNGFAALAAAEARLDAMPVRPCPKPSTPSTQPPVDGPTSADVELLKDFPVSRPPTFDEPLIPPVPPKSFCSHTERANWLRNVFWPFYERAKANSVAAISHYNALERRLNEIAYAEGAESPRYKAAERFLKAYAPIKKKHMDFQTEVLKIHDAASNTPVIDCSPPTETGTGGTPPPTTPAPGTPVGPVTPPVTDGPATPPKPPLPPGVSPPQLERVRIATLPDRFCSDSEKMAFLVEIYHPAAEAASKNALKTSAYRSLLSNLIYEATVRRDQPTADALKREYESFRPIAEAADALQLRMMKMRDEILRIPVVDCSKPTPPRTAPPPPPSPAPPPPTDGEDLRDIIIDAGRPRPVPPKTPPPPSDLEELLIPGKRITTPVPGDPPPPARPKLPPPNLNRPQFERVRDVTPPASFCSEFERNAFLLNAYNPAVAAALANAEKATAHETRLNAMFTEYMRGEGGAGWAAVKKEQAEFRVIADAARAEATRLQGLYSRIMAVPVKPCPTETAPPPPPPTAPVPPTAPGPTDRPVIDIFETPAEDIPEIPGTFCDEAERQALGVRLGEIAERLDGRIQNTVDAIRDVRGDLLAAAMQGRTTDMAAYEEALANLEARLANLLAQMQRLGDADLRLEAATVKPCPPPTEGPGDGPTTSPQPPQDGVPPYIGFTDFEWPPVPSQFCSPAQLVAYMNQLKALHARLDEEGRRLYDLSRLLAATQYGSVTPVDGHFDALARYSPDLAGMIGTSRGLFYYSLRALIEDRLDYIDEYLDDIEDELDDLYDALNFRRLSFSCPPPVEDGPTTGPDEVRKPCPPKVGRNPITVGPNSKVGSGAQLRSKVGGFLAGQAMGALGLGGGGGGGGSDGPQLWTCKIKDSEYTVFDDPLTGVSLRVGAKRAKGGKVVIFSEIAKSPDKGTFQTAFLERPSTGETLGPSDIGPCDLWGEWKLTVSWTKTTYVNGQVVDRQSGGWSEGGFFKIPGTLSKADAPTGFWKQMGFSSAQMGAREMGMIFDVPPGGGPLTFVIHVTRPKGDPVTTVPFVLTMTEGEGGVFTFTRAEDPPCPPEELSAPGPDIGPAPLPPADPGFEAPPPPLSAGGPTSATNDDDDPGDSDDRPTGQTPEEAYAVQRAETGAQELVAAWRATDAELLTQIRDGRNCDPAIRDQILANIAFRRRMLAEGGGDIFNAAVRQAFAIDGDRMRQLEELLGETPATCDPTPPPSMTIADGPAPGAAPEPAPLPRDAGGALPPPPPPRALPPWYVDYLPTIQVASSGNLETMRGLIDEADKAPCPEGYKRALDRIRWSRDEFRRMVPRGAAADSIRDVIDETLKRLDQMENEVLRKMAASRCPPSGSVFKTDGPDPAPAPYTPPPGGSTGPRLPFTPPPERPISEPARVDRFVSEARTADSGLAKALEDAARACPGDPARSWTALRNRARAVLMARLLFLSSMRPMGPGTEHMTDAVGREFSRTMLLLQEVNALRPPPCADLAPDQQPTEEETESILDDIEEKLVIG